MGTNRLEDNSLLFWGSNKTHYTNITSILLLTLIQFYSKVKHYVSVFCFCFFLFLNLFVQLQNAGQGAIWREIMQRKVASVIHSSVSWVLEERWDWGT